MRLSIALMILIAVSCKSDSTTKFEKDEIKLIENAYNVGFLIMNGVFNTELTAPYDIFQHTQYRKNIKPMNVFTIAGTSDPIKTFEGLYILPDFNYMESHPPIDILVVPSAEHHLDSDLDNKNMIDWVTSIDKTALYITSHCDGAFVLAKAGLLDNSESTTFPGDIDKYKKMFPKLKVHEDVVFVHDEKYITSAGGARSFDAALYLCEFLYGKETAEQLAGGLVIDWNLDEINYKLIEK